MFASKFRILLLLAIPIIFFSKVLFGNYIFAVGDLSGSDLLDLHYPFRFGLKESLFLGRLPLWESNLAMGFPQLAEGQTGVFYPVNILLSFINSEAAINLSVVIAITIALVASYFYFRLLNKSHLASGFGAIAFSYSSFFIAKLKHINMINVASLFPLLLITTHLYFHKGKTKYALYTGIIIAFMIFAGHPQITFYSILVLIFYSVFEGKQLVNLFKFIILSIGLGIALSAVQVMPTYELLKLSSRIEADAVLSENFSFHPSNLITLISPYHFGNPAEATYDQDIRTRGLFWENTTYLGFGPLILAGYWLIKSVKRKNFDKHTRFFIFLSIISLLLMLGHRTPLIFIFSKTIPFFSLFRFPVRFNLFLIFSLSFLAVCAFDYFQKTLKGNYKKIFLIIFIPVLLIDLFIFADSYIGYLPLEEFREKPQIAKRLEKENDLFRIYNLTQYSESPYLAFGWKNADQSLIDARLAIPPNNNLLYDIDSFTERGWFEGGLSIERRNNLETAILLGALRNPQINAKVLGMYNVKYLISFQDIWGAGIEKVEEYELGSYFQNTLKLYENKQVLPRAYFVSDAIYITKKDEFFNIISDTSFEPLRTVVIEREARTPEAVFSDNLPASSNNINLLKYSDTEVVIQADVKNSGYLVLSDVNYPGWKVDIDGEEREILIADYIVRAVELSPGQHTVRFYYRPDSLIIGGILSMLAVLTLVATAFGLVLTEQ